VVQHDFSSYCIAVLRHNVNICPDTHDFKIDHPYTGNKNLRNTLNDPDSQQVNNNLLQVKIFSNIDTSHNIVCSFAIVNTGAIFFSLYMDVHIDTLSGKQVSFMLNSYHFKPFLIIFQEALLQS
jgi:hypothetical protein